MYGRWTRDPEGELGASSEAWCSFDYLTCDAVGTSWLPVHTVRSVLGDMIVVVWRCSDARVVPRVGHELLMGFADE